MSWEGLFLVAAGKVDRFHIKYVCNCEREGTVGDTTIPKYRTSVCPRWCWYCFGSLGTVIDVG